MTKKTLLLVDDDNLNLKILEEILSDHNYITLLARDGIEALEMLDKHPEIAVILLDRMMPNMNGMEFMEAFKKQEKYANIPVIMQTAAAAPRDVIDGSNTGVYYYLTKPYEADMVLSVVRSALGA